MQLFNKTKNILLTENLIEIGGFPSVIGQIGKDQPQALYFKTHFGIHTFGLKFPIDVLIVDSQNRVVKAKSSLSPWSIFLWNIKFDTVIELPAGSLEKTKTAVGDEMNFE